MSKLLHLSLFLMILPGLFAQNLIGPELILSLDDTENVLLKEIQTFNTNHREVSIPITNVPYQINSNEDYQFYYKKYIKASKLWTAGIIITLGGLGMGITGLTLALRGMGGYGPDSRAYEDFVLGLFVSGVILTNLGIPLWSIGYNMRINNKKAMDEIDRQAKLSLAPTRHGIGLTLRF